MKIMLLGKNGQVGWELQRTLAPLGRVTALGRRELDLADERAIRRAVRDTAPDLIVNAAAYTAVDRAEAEPELAMTINGSAPGILAEEAARLGAGLVHYSTDYVFDGDRETPYTEDERPNPVNVYGKTKLAGEEAIRQIEVSHLILRTVWVYSLRGKNFLLTMQRLAQEKKELKVVDDQIGCPTWNRMIAEATAQLLAHSKGKLKGSGATYHLCSAGQTSWYGFARAIFSRLYPGGDMPVRLTAISSSQYQTAARRPANSVLSSARLYRDHGIMLPPWHDMLDLALAE